VKRRDLLAHLELHGCTFVREGGNHTWYVGPDGRPHSAVPRHREIVEFLARKICRELGVPTPGK
jgi:predicted RNA binding protein YcfA (HicA-like mRNA interferase family)